MTEPATEPVRRPWWRLSDTPVPGGVPELARALLWAELAIVLLLSLGRSAVYSVVSILSALTAPARSPRRRPTSTTRSPRTGRGST